MKKRGCSLLLALLMILTLALPVHAEVNNDAVNDVDSNSWTDWAPAEEIVSGAAAVMDADTGQVLYSKGMHAEYYPASITKVMTALLIIENCDLNGQVAMTQTGLADAYNGSSNCGALEGEVFTVEQCLEMILIKSANDVATQMCEYLDGSVEAFAARMNARAKELGCLNTNFTNANGLEDPNHYTSAYDMALIMKEALKHDVFRNIIGYTAVTIPATNLQGERVYATHNDMINPESPFYFEGCLGGKTGYTDISGSTLVCAANRNGRTLIGVVLKAPETETSFNNMASILNYGFNNFQLTDITNGIPFASGNAYYLPMNAQLKNISVKDTEEETADGEIVIVTYGNHDLGTSVMTEENLEAYQTKLDELNGREPEKKEEEKGGFLGFGKGKDKSDESVKKEKKDHSGILRIIIVVLVVLVVLCLILLIAGAIRNANRRKRRRNRNRNKKR